MELINECSMRFAEDKDFRLLVGCRFLVVLRIPTVFPDRGQHHGSFPYRLLGQRRTQ